MMMISSSIFCFVLMCFFPSFFQKKNKKFKLSNDPQWMTILEAFFIGPHEHISCARSYTPSQTTLLACQFCFMKFGSSIKSTSERTTFFFFMQQYHALTSGRILRYGTTTESESLISWYCWKFLVTFFIMHRNCGSPESTMKICW